MIVIAGLGNPGKDYNNTRHNMGFRVIDSLAEKNGISMNKEKFKSVVGEGRIAGCRVLLVKPQTYMNLSGEAVRDIMNFYKLDPEDLIVIYDDLDIERGSLRIRKGGSAGSHNGMKSVVRQIQSDRFPRIRVGIGIPKEEKTEHRPDTINYVIGRVSKDEMEELDKVVDRASESVMCILSDGIDNAMNRYNTSKKKNREKKRDRDEK